MLLARDVYRLSNGLPRREQYRITAQLIKAAISVPANIAEGHSRGTRKDYAHFISIARGSCAEVETFLILLVSAELAPREAVVPVLAKAEEVGRMLSTLRERLKRPPSSLAPNP